MAETATLPRNESRVKDEIKRIQNYVWARHVDGSDQYDPAIDEDEAIRVLDEFYSEVGNRNSEDQVYLGILLFEKAFDEEDEQGRLDLFRRARKIFLFYRKVTGEDDWDAVEDRLEDIEDVLAEFEGGGDGDASGAAAASAPEGASTETAPAEKATTATAVAEPEAPPAAEKAPEKKAEKTAEKTAETKTEPRKKAAKEEAPAPAAESESDAPPAAEKPAEAAPEVETAEREAREREEAEAFIADLPVVEGMQLIPAGTFVFGADGRDDFKESFYMDKTPVTNEEYMRFVRETQYREPRYAEDERFNAPDQPVVGVSLADAQQFAKWAGKELPTEEQWEKAARGPDGRTYPWGNDPPGASDACYGQDPAEGRTMPVGQSLRNVSPYGVLDMAGNVWEWTRSAYRRGSEFRVVRGGSYNDPPEMLTTTFRLEAHPKDKSEALGFRCVKNIH